MVNLETHRLLDLLPDRTADAVFPWLKRHQEIDIVSRDRASAYADAANRALPDAIQVADRYHVLQNLREHLQRVLDRNRSCLPTIEDTPLKGASSASQRGNAGIPSDLPPEETLLVFPESAKTKGSDQLLAPEEPEHPADLDNTERDLSCLTYTDRKKKINQDKRVSRYEEVMALHQTGIGQRALARQLGMSRKTVKLFVSSPVCPQRAPGTGLRPKGKNKVDSYRSYLRERWDAGIQNSSLLFGEIKERGYTGSASLLRMALSE